MAIFTKLEYRIFRFCSIFTILIFVSLLDLTAEFKLTSIGANQKVGSSNETFDKNWLCENTGNEALSVTLNTNKSSRTQDSWGLENILEKFNLEAGGTQNCGIKLTTGKKGIGDAEVNIQTDGGFDRNILITFFTDEFDIINCNLSSLPNNQTNYNAYFVPKELDVVNFTQNDFNNLLSQSQNAKTIVVNKNNGELDSTEAEILVDLFMSGKSLVISGADIFYNLSITHPEHRIWNAFRFIINETIVNENYNQDYGIEIIDTKNTTNNVYDSGLKLNRVQLENKPIRSIIPQLSDAIDITQNIYLEGTEDIIGFTAEYPDMNSITILNFDIEDIYNEFYVKIIEDVLDFKVLSIENDKTNNNLITYPNPITSVSENIKIKLNELTDNSELLNNVEIYNELGQPSNLQYELINNEILINIQNYKIGVYYIKVSIGKEIYYSKFIKN